MASAIAVETYNQTSRGTRTGERGQLILSTHSTSRRGICGSCNRLVKYNELGGILDHGDGILAYTCEYCVWDDADGIHNQAV